jgi:hypothetical protein
MWMFHFSLPGIHPLIESTAASTNPIIKIFFVIIVFFELLNVSNFAAKLLQKPIYIQILRFIFTMRKLLKYRRMEKEKFICRCGGFIWIDEVGAFCGIIDVLGAEMQVDLRTLIYHRKLNM